MFLDSRKRKNSNTTLKKRKWLKLVEVPDSDIVSENASENVVQNAARKNEVQSKITSFFNAKN